jgi:UPF0271 protein
MTSVTHPRSIDLNADVGEGGARDALLFASGITSANVACGAHAGDDATMIEACALAVRHGVALGAHPGYADRENFGRAEYPLELARLGILVGDQMRVLQAHARRAGLVIRHVKPHGALYHFLNREAEHALLFAASVKALATGAAIFGPPAGELREACDVAGVRFVAEGFIDRGYRGDGSLIPRGEPGAELHDETAAVAQALALARSGRVQTLCVHGDGVAAARLLAAARAALAAEGFRLSAPASVSR